MYFFTTTIIVHTSGYENYLHV